MCLSASVKVDNTCLVYYTHSKLHCPINLVYIYTLMLLVLALTGTLTAGPEGAGVSDGVTVHR